MTIRGAEIEYWEYSAAPAAPGARTLLVVHGFRGDHHGLERVVEALPGLRVIMPDLPGFGTSAPLTDAPHDVPSYNRFLADLMAGLQLGPDTVLLGHSFGSIVASHFVAEHPGSVSELILINPIAAPALEGPKGILSKLAESYYLASARLPARAGNALLRSKTIVHLMSITMAKTKDKALLRFIHQQHYSYFSLFADRGMLLESFRASVGGTVRQVASQLTLPVLLIAGAQDEIATLPTQHKLMTLLPDGQLVVIPGVGHLIHYETPVPAAAAITGFLAAHPIAGGTE
ncbi:alpha/beta hydrolase [Paenarthrobacter sp. PH39-S1]|uniref:alpha/beta fold hydrolase n=1 Tax=Paenarthrobacter sp. PH39-S1 TaxID=3046204 RepID=UPI0024B8DE02|nr:alpha/beta hydrolase [Paenarthrobacter sp. PH39-S1]MDJ0357963.1 alpha/beta hydrolase [Paenarthrobacter sp. PH39-S1]